MDWSGNQSNIGQKEMTVGIWRANSGKFQRHIWKLAAALYDVVFAMDKNGTCSGVIVNITSCITPPNLLLIGNVTFVIGSDNEFSVSCFNCLLSNCVSALDDGQSVMVVHQPALNIIPINLSEPWYSEKGLQVLEEVSQALSRSKRVVGLIIAGIAALITLRASTTASAIALTQEVKTATFVNYLAKYVTNALSNQEDLDRHLEQWIDVLYI